MFRLFLLTLTMILLPACGNKGDLYLPEEDIGPTAEQQLAPVIENKSTDQHK